MMKPKISVIVPLHNAMWCIRRCVESIMSQTFSDYELILVNDGSTDASLDACNEYAAKDKRTKVLNRVQGGVSSARNLGLEYASGEFVTFIDADDWVEQDYFFHLMSATHNADFVVSGFQYVSAVGREIKYAARITASLSSMMSLDELFLLPHLMTTPWGKLYRMDVIRSNNIKFDEWMRMGEDTCFVNDYLCHVRNIAFVEHSEYKYLFDPGMPLGIKYRMSTSEFVYHYTHIICSMEKVASSQKQPLTRSIDNEKKFFFRLYVEVLKNLKLEELKQFAKKYVELKVNEHVPPTLEWRKKLLLRLAVQSPVSFYIMIGLLKILKRHG